MTDLDKFRICAAGCGKIGKNALNWKTCKCTYYSYTIGIRGREILTCIQCNSQYLCQNRKLSTFCCDSEMEYGHKVNFNLQKFITKNENDIEPELRTLSKIPDTDEIIREKPDEFIPFRICSSCGKIGKDSMDWKNCDCLSEYYLLGYRSTEILTCLHCECQYGFYQRRLSHFCCDSKMEKGHKFPYERVLDTKNENIIESELISLSKILENDIKFVENVTILLENDDSLVCASEEILEYVEKAQKIFLRFSALPDCLEKCKFETSISDNFRKKYKEATLYKSIFDKVVDKSDIETISKIDFLQKVYDIVEKKNEDKSSEKKQENVQIFIDNDSESDDELFEKVEIKIIDHKTFPVE